jgi:hypothetical protein
VKSGYTGYKRTLINIIRHLDVSESVPIACPTGYGLVAAFAYGPASAANSPLTDVRQRARCSAPLASWRIMPPISAPRSTTSSAA